MLSDNNNIFENDAHSSLHTPYISVVPKGPSEKAPQGKLCKSDVTICTRRCPTSFAGQSI